MKKILFTGILTLLGCVSHGTVPHFSGQPQCVSVLFRILNHSLLRDQLVFDDSVIVYEYLEFEKKDSLNEKNNPYRAKDSIKMPLERVSYTLYGGSLVGDTVVCILWPGTWVSTPQFSKVSDYRTPDKVVRYAIKNPKAYYIVTKPSTMEVLYFHEANLRCPYMEIFSGESITSFLKNPIDSILYKMHIAQEIDTFIEPYNYYDKIGPDQKLFQPLIHNRLDSMCICTHAETISILYFSKFTCDDIGINFLKSIDRNKVNEMEGLKNE